ncbi:MAG: tape measure protein, partial [Pseudomonas sp.]|nr:tape measure protein [Pseudomonas sp.]
MASDSQIKLALRIEADMRQAISAFGEVTAGLNDLDTKSQALTTSNQKLTNSISSAGETTEQQAERIRAMVQASLAQVSALGSVRAETAHLSQTQETATSNWQASAAAQTAAMQAHWDTVRAAEQQAIAEQEAAESVAEANTEQEKQAKSLNKLLGQLNSTEKALAQLDQQERELAEHFRSGRIDAESYAKALNEIKSRRNALQGQAGQVKEINKELGGMPSMLKKLAIAVTAAFSVREIAKASEAYTAIRNRLALVTEDSEELAQAQDAVFQIAQNARQPLEATAELYQRIATNSDELKISASGVAGVVETISKTLAISGASSQASSAAMIQLGQAFASGTLRGQELNSVLEQAPALAKALAAGLGVTIGELRKLGAEGKLTTENVIQALQSQGAAVDQQFSKIEVTGSQAMAVLGNSLVKVVGELNEATGAGTAFGDLIMQLSQWLDSGVLTDGVIASFAVWSGVFDAMSQDLASLQLDLDSLADGGESTAQFLARAFL